MNNEMAEDNDEKIMKINANYKTDGKEGRKKK